MIMLYVICLLTQWIKLKFFLTLIKDEMPTNLEQAENAIKRHEAFLTTMEANDDKVKNVIQFM